MSRRSTVLTAIIASSATALVVGGLAYAAIPGSDGTITACYKNAGGNVRVINAPTATCATGETKLVWNQKGVAGPKGATGATGARGPAGSAVGGPCTWGSRSGVISQSIDPSTRIATYTCDPLLLVTYDGSTNVPKPLAVTITGGRRGPGCTPAALSCSNTTDFAFGDTISVNYSCSSSCPVVVGSTITWGISFTTGSGGEGGSIGCTVTKTGSGPFRCTATQAITFNAGYSHIGVYSPTIT